MESLEFNLLDVDSSLETDDLDRGHLVAVREVSQMVAVDLNLKFHLNKTGINRELTSYPPCLQWIWRWK